MGQTEEGLEHARFALVVAPRQREALDADEAYFRVGMIDRTLPLFERALEADPLSATVRQEIARYCFHTGAYQKGIDTVKLLFGEGHGG